MAFDTILTPELVENYTRQGYWQGRTITDFLDEYAAATPDKVAFIDPRGQVTYGQLRHLVDHAALGLLELGVRPGDVVSFQLPNWIEWVIVHYAATRIGAVSNPLIPIYRERELRFMVGLAKSKVLVIPSRFRGFDYPTMIETCRPDWPALEHILVVDGQPGEGTSSWEDFMATPWEERRDTGELATLRPDGNDVTLLIFTSGTTGEPKGVMHTHNTLVAMNTPLRERFSLSEVSVFHMASTLAHLTGLAYGGRLPVQIGATGVLQDVWSPAEFAQLVERHRITYTSAATPFLYDLLNLPDLDSYDVSSLEKFVCVGAPIPRVLVRRAGETLPSLTVHGGYGQSENGIVTVGIPGDPEEKVISTDGYPLPGMRIRVVDDFLAELPPGTEGNLEVVGPFLFVGYAERLEMTRESFDSEWFQTGDLAVIDADGYLSIAGRTKDVIIRGGENIPVAYVENVLYEHPDIESVAVVAVPDPRLQERACACVVLKPGVEKFTMGDMKAFLESKGVAKPYWPERIELLTELPRTPSGKIQKFRLRDSLASS